LPSIFKYSQLIVVVVVVDVVAVVLVDVVVVVVVPIGLWQHLLYLTGLLHPEHVLEPSNVVISYPEILHSGISLQLLASLSEPH